MNVKAPEGEYVTDPAALVLLPGAAQAVRRLNDAGLRVVLVSNQRCVARGLASMAEVARVHDRLAELLAAAGAHLDGWYVCPHEARECDCRKPLPGLLLAAAADAGIDLAAATMVGDAESDVLAGRAAGTATVRIAPPGTASAADLVVPTLADAVDHLVRSGSVA